MIEDPPLVKVRRKVPRPTKAQVAAIAGTPTSFVVDAMDGRGALSPEIKPIVAEFGSFCGIAVTCHVGAADNLGVMVAQSLAQPGDVIVAATDRFHETAVIGDLMLGMMGNLGVAGFVTDGTVRDIPGLRDAGVPCFAAGVTPNSPTKNGPGTVNLPVAIGTVTVGPGDIVIGDQDGVVVIPFDQIDAVIARLVDVRQAEKELLAKVKGGLGVPPYVEELFRTGKVKEI